MASGSLRNLARALIGIVIGAFFLWLALRQTSLEQVRTILTKSNLGWLFISLAVYAADLAVRVSRWRILLKDIKILSFKSVGIALLIGYGANNLLPARLGELFRADFVGRRYRLSRSAVIGSIFLERVLDGLIVVLCLAIGRLFISQQNAVLASLTAVSSLLFIGIFLGLWLLGRKSGRNWIERFPPAIASRIQSFRQGSSMLSGSDWRKVIGLSLIIWILEGTVLWALLQAVAIALNLQQMLLLLGVVSLSTLIPSAPGFIGTYQYAYAFAVSLFGYESARGVAAATIAQVVLLGSVTLTGFGMYIYLHTKGDYLSKNIN